MHAPVVVILALVGLPHAACDEMAFVNVTANDMIYIRSLDITVKPMVGVQNLFSADPMAAHDWSNPRTVASSLDAQLSAWNAAAPAAASLKALRLELAPLFAVLPKNAHGRLDNGTARYGLHRHFAASRGWAVKGLEPAGASWVRTMRVGPEVRQVMKFIMPAFLQELVTQKLGDARGIDLHWFAVMTATIRHIAHAEITEYLYSIFRILGYQLSGEKAIEEVEDIVLTFVMVYAFGTDLEASTRADVLAARCHLDAHHQGWTELRSYIQQLLAAAQPKPKDFSSTLAFVEDFTSKYGDWQDRDCKLASDRLSALPGARVDGRVPLSALSPVREPGRRVLFAETEKELGRLGVLERDGEGRPQLLVANYLLSQAMCLTTAGVHTVCCRNRCDELLAQVEAAAGGPEATPEVISAVLGLEPTSARAVQAMATGEGRGTVSLHGRDFSKLMHQAFPLVCPLPGDSERTNPKTPGEWMADPGQDPITTEELYYELSDALARYTTLGAGPLVAHDGSLEAAEDSGVRATWQQQRQQHRLFEDRSAPRRRSVAPLQAAAAASMVALVLVVARSMLGSVRRASGRCGLSKKGAADIV
mmetsp:Transcript_52245/g.150437  ORF Transcript_52245/g.150437 Transcript_52245/m.150437 type:complete len:591 (-) Transcript_52245:77-1849(-)